MKNINLIIDFDSTFIKLETLDALAEISLQNNSNKKSIIEDITSITKSAMNGEINFDIALSLENLEHLYREQTFSINMLIIAI